MGTSENEGKNFFRVKKCPECLAHLQLTASRCHECNTRVGPVDRNGMASRTINWIGYLVSIVAWVGFAFYIWWAFFSNKE